MSQLRKLLSILILTAVLTTSASGQGLTHSAAIGGVKVRFKNAQSEPGDADKQWKEAIELLKTDLASATKDKDKEESYFYLGAVHFRKGDFAGAYDAFTKALTFGKKHFEEGEKLSGGVEVFSIKMSMNDIKLKTFSQANKAYNDALGITNPDSAKLDSMKKLLYKSIDKFRQVLTWDSVAFINGKNYVAAIYGTISYAYIQLMNVEPEEGNKKALREKIIENLIKLSSLDKKNFFVVYNIFTVYYQDKNYDKAIEWIDRGLQIETKDSAALAAKVELIRNKALIYDMTGKPDLALKTYLEALKSDSNNADIHFNLARLYSDRKETDKALAEFKLVKKLKPKDVLSNYQIANEGYKAYQERRHDIIVKYSGTPKKVSEVLKPSIESCMADLKDAVGALESEIATAPDKAESYLIIGTAYNYLAQLEGDLVYDFENKEKAKNQKPYFEKAVENMKKAIEIKKDYKSAWYQLGVAYFNLQMKKEAENAFEKAK
jgi:tetratricopeptide (TPR) repeat protein